MAVRQDISIDETGFSGLSVSAAGSQLQLPQGFDVFVAAFQREGSDLVVTEPDGDTLRVTDYFRSEVPADLVADNGAVLKGSLVVTLAGPVAPGQYAQAGATDTSLAIGQVETLEGAATVQRSDGTVETLGSETLIFQNDVVSTGSDGSVSLIFVDGTIFTLAANSRMVIDELIYSEGGAGNSGAFNLVQGSFVFIAGQVAKTGDMEVATPTATMGIRGTTVLVDVTTERGVATVEVALTRDFDGSVGVVELRDLDGNLISNITTTDLKWIVSPVAGETRSVERTAEDDAADNILIAEAFTAFQIATNRVEGGDSYIRQGSSSPGNPNVLESDPTE
ncbi:MAG: FecR family protein, partial [Pseudomonadota bacterium]